MQIAEKTLLICPGIFTCIWNVTQVRHEITAESVTKYHHRLLSAR